MNRVATTTFSTVLFVNDIDKNLEYFTKTLGFTEVERWQAPDGTTAHATVAFGKGATAATIDLGSTKSVTQGGMDNYDFGQFGENIKNSPHTLGNGVILFFRVPNVDKFFAKINANGAIVDEPPTDQMWGQRTISILTPDNHYLTFWQPIKGWKPTEGSGLTLVKNKLTTKRRNQRKYAATTKSVRAKAKTTTGGKGRIKHRPAAKKLRGELGLEDN